MSRGMYSPSCTEELRTCNGIHFSITHSHTPLLYRVDRLVSVRLGDYRTVGRLETREADLIPEN